jgi:hypothetical protein
MQKQPKELIWYVKWFATIMVLVAITFRSSGYTPLFHMIDLVTSTVGTIGWLYVAIIWKDRALIMMNTAIFIILVSGVLSNI